jgi:hypothetical protein
MDVRCRRFNPPSFRADILLNFPKSPKADNLLITKGNFLHFSLSKAENMLKTSNLANCKIGPKMQGFPANFHRSTGASGHLGKMAASVQG